MDMRKLLVTVIAASTLALVGGKAMAEEIDVVVCAEVGTVQEWNDLGMAGCIQEDKQWVLNSADTAALALTTVFSMPLNTIHSLVLSGFGGDSGTWDLDYTITVLDPKMYISTMSAGSDVNKIPVTVTKTVTGDTTGFILTSVDGSQVSKTGLAATTLTVAEHIVVGNGGLLFSVSNSFEQKQVPEPATLALLGIGLLGLGFSRRRRPQH